MKSPRIARRSSWSSRALGIALLAVVALTLAAEGRAASPKLVSEEFMVPSGDPGIEIYIRNKHPEGVARFAAERILLFVHGATYPAEATFDLPLGGFSMMDFVARHGYDVYLVDVRGYGRSMRPPEMGQPADQNDSVVRTDTAVKDVGAAVDFILKRRGVAKINLMGWSWGTAIMGWYAAQHNDKVNKLVLYAPLWVGYTGALAGSGKLGAYRNVTPSAARDRWLKDVPAEKKAATIPAGWFDAFAAANLASDPAGSKQTPPVMRAPNGVLQDMREHWSVDKPLYDPGEIRVPTFLVHAEWDQELPTSMLQAYFAKLTNAPYRRYLEIGEGTHFVFLEKNRVQLFDAVLAFLDEAFKPAE